MMYFLLDSRAGKLMSGKPTANIEDYDDDWGRFINFAGSANECCKYANNNTIGDNCIVSDEDGNIKWEWHKAGRWLSPFRKRKNKRKPYGNKKQ